MKKIEEKEKNIEQSCSTWSVDSDVEYVGVSKEKKWHTKFMFLYYPNDRKMLRDKVFFKVR